MMGGISKCDIQRAFMPEAYSVGEWRADVGYQLKLAAVCFSRCSEQLMNRVCTVSGGLRSSHRQKARVGGIVCRRAECVCSVSIGRAASCVVVLSVCAIGFSLLHCVRVYNQTTALYDAIG